VQPASATVLSIALGAAAIAGKEIMSGAVRDAYAVLKALILLRYPRSSVRAGSAPPKSPSCAAPHVLGGRRSPRRAGWRKHHQEGRDKGLNLSLGIAIAVARRMAATAATPAERGAADNYLGMALQTLGARERHGTPHRGGRDLSCGA